MSKSRLETFIDAILAIIMTILVLDLKEPKTTDLAGFWALKANFFAFTLSFFWLGAMWINMHNNWYHIKKINTGIMWASLIMLFFASLFPYSTNLVAEHFFDRGAQIFYGLLVLLITFANLILYKLLRNANYDEVGQQFSTSSVYSRQSWLYVDIIIKIIGLLLAIFVYPPAVMYSILTTLLVIVIPNQFINPHTF